MESVYKPVTEETTTGETDKEECKWCGNLFTPDAISDHEDTCDYIIPKDLTKESTNEEVTEGAFKLTVRMEAEGPTITIAQSGHPIAHMTDDDFEEMMLQYNKYKSHGSY